ncbi:penicillin-binding protein 1A [Aerophototrophica crusticola]|uniref:Penicillin-binding protein 1A n=1 Tax=Aerophototrophica crusticola TaxID=1709002 RepID=A0A858R5N7_9PROT|nr:penicillin-binding protein 1A [Rhodospirillaceae bacterium B3]
MKRIIVGIVAFIAVLGGIGVGAAAWAFWHYGQDLPEYRQLADYRPPVATRVHAGDGRLVAEFAQERRVFVPIQAIPKRVSRAFISAEDQNFYEHRGVDWFAVVRAQLQNIKNLGSDRRPIGASTITQQVTRLFLLNNEVSYVRKIKEAILAHRIELAMSKDQILEIYLNEIFLGNRAYGVGAAALNYFDKALDEVTIAEAAFLASLPKAPDRYFRDRFRDAAIQRRNYVIGRMLEDGFITKEEAEQASAEPLRFRDTTDQELVQADYFVEEVRREVANVYGEQALYGGGLSVRTTLEPEMQGLATRALRAGLIAYDRRDGYRGPVSRLEGMDSWKDRLADVKAPAGAEGWHLAAVLEVSAEEARIGLADGTRGRIPLSELKWARRTKGGEFVGPPVQKASDAVSVADVVLVEKLPPQPAKAQAPSKTKDGKPAKPAAEAPAATDLYALRQVPEIQGALVAMDPHTGRVLAMAGGFSARISVFNRATQALRQPGSAFKPFVYLAALDQGFTPSSLVLDAPFALDQGGGLGKWKPSNYSERFYGPTPLRVGIEKSRNVMTVRLAQYMGMEPVVKVARDFGIYDNLPPQLSMALGAGETTVLKMTTAYAMLVNGGRKITPTFIDRVQDRTGKTIYRHDNRPCEGCANPLPENSPAEVADAAAPSVVPVNSTAATQVVDQAATTVPADPGAVPVVPDDRTQVGDPRTIYQMVSMLEGVVQRGTAARLKELNRPLAGKTGTTNDAHDVWFIGFSPDLVAGVFVGFDTPRSLGDNESGSSVAVPIFKDFMEGALKDQPTTPFRVPPGLNLVRVDPETGRPAAFGARNAIWEGFIPGTEPGADEGVLDGGDEGAGFVSQSDTGAPGQPSTQPASVGSGTGGVY